MRAFERAAALTALQRAEEKAPPGRETLFDDVFDELPAELRRQRDELEAHLAEFAREYANDGKH